MYVAKFVEKEVNEFKTDKFEELLGFVFEVISDGYWLEPKVEGSKLVVENKDWSERLEVSGLGKYELDALKCFVEKFSL